MDGLKNSKSTPPKALNDPLLTGKYSLLYIYIALSSKQLTLKRQEGMVCSYLLHGYDIIQVLKLCREEQRKADFFCSLRMG